MVFNHIRVYCPLGIFYVLGNYDILYVPRYWKTAKFGIKHQSINDILFLLLEGDFKDILPEDLSELPPDEDLLSIIGPELSEDDCK